MIYILVILDLVSEIFAALTVPLLTLPSAVRQRKAAGSFAKAWKEAINFRGRQREIAKDHKLGRYQPAMEGAMRFWQSWMQWRGVNLDVAEIERIYNAYPDVDANGLPKCILPLADYANREWQRQRPWHYSWHKLLKRIRSS